MVGSAYMISPLTERQTQVLQLLADGKTQQEAATELGIAYPTVKNIIYGHATYRGINKRLGKDTVTAMVAEAMRRMWIA